MNNLPSDFADISFDGLQLVALDAPQVKPRAGEARQFCLDVIKEFYGFDYRKDWHEDLDALLLADDANHYCPAQGGAFWLLLDDAGEIIATAGLRSLKWKPWLLEDLKERYPSGDEVGSLWRVYVRKDWRAKGLGKKLSALAEKQAAALGYNIMYLHASTDAEATMRFWQSCGYAPFGEIDFSTHFDKKLAA